MIILPIFVVYSLLTMLLLVCVMLFFLLFWEKQLFGSIVSLFGKKQQRIAEQGQRTLHTSQHLLQNAAQDATDLSFGLHTLNQTAETILEKQMTHLLEKKQALFENLIERLYKDSEEKLTKAYDAVEQQLKDYTITRQKEIETQLGERLERVIKETIGKTLTPSDHQAIIKQALEHAQKEGVLS